MEQDLAGGLAAAVHKVDAICAESVLGSSGDLLGAMDTRCKVVGGDVEEVGYVRARDHEGVAARDCQSVATAGLADRYVPLSATGLVDRARTREVMGC